MNTKYEWAPGKRGKFLAPAGRHDLAAFVFVGTDGAALRELRRLGGLYGMALADALELEAQDEAEGKGEKGK